VRELHRAYRSSAPRALAVDIVTEVEDHRSISSPAILDRHADVCFIADDDSSA
jgi:hypothetical protein